MVIEDPKAEGGKRASSAVFRDDADGSSMSVYLESGVLGLGLHLSDVVHAKPAGWAVASIPMAVLAEEEQLVRPDPITDAIAPHPCDPAHAVADGLKEPKGRRERIARQSPLAHVVL